MKVIRMMLPVFFVCKLFGGVGEDFVANKKGELEMETAGYLSIVAPFLPPNPYILEAGAHSGEDTVLFAATWPEARIFAFEPVPIFFGRMVRSLSLKDITNVTAFPIGLFSSTEERPFYYSQNCGGASSYLPDGGIPEIDYNDVQMTLPCMILDEWASKYDVDHIDFMWLDMEGAEYYALSSSPKILSTVRVILTELSFRSFREGHTLYDTLKPFLEANGFTLYKIWGYPHWQATGLFVRTELLHSGN